MLQSFVAYGTVPIAVDHGWCLRALTTGSFRVLQHNLK